MKEIRYITPLILIIIGISFFILTLQLPTGNARNPMEPVYFPLFTALGLIVFGLIYLIQEIKAYAALRNTVNELPFITILIKTSVLLIFTIIYAILFEPLGFLLSSILFLIVMLFYLNGKKTWVKNIVLSILLSLSSWVVFALLLNINLP